MIFLSPEMTADRLIFFLWLFLVSQFIFLGGKVELCVSNGKSLFHISSICPLWGECYPKLPIEIVAQTQKPTLKLFG